MSAHSDLNWIKFWTIAGATASVFSAGAIFGFSAVSIPSLVAVTPSNEAKSLTQFRRLYDLGKVIVPAIAGVAALSTSTALFLQQQALTHRDISEPKYIKGRLSVAALSSVAIPLWTIMFMSSTNNALFALEEAGGVSAGTSAAGKVKELLGRWQVLNYARSVFPLIGGLLGLSTL